MLEPGTQVDLGRLGNGTVVEEIGAGGQGWVYRVETATGPVALKWYKPPFDDDQQRQAIAYLIEMDPPDHRFLWPQALATAAASDSFGYVMDLRPDDHVGLLALLRGVDEGGRTIDPDFSILIRVCLELTQAFLKLHLLGLCYRDISFGNLFFNPETGDVLVCDNDNVGVDDGGKTVRGTRRFMAPEVMTSEADPSAQTDRYSLAVTLFYILFIAHPLEGVRSDIGREDTEWFLANFGTEALFIFDPDDPSNRPLASSAAAQYWKLYPAFLRDLFVRSFTEGLRDPIEGRVRESVWADAMVRLRDEMMPCGSCGKTRFWDFDDPRQVCARCGKPSDPPLVLTVRNYRIVISPLLQLNSSHFDWDHDRATLIADVVTHPKEPGRLGLRNATTTPWSVAVGGRHQAFQPKQALDPNPGQAIRFPAGEGTISRAPLRSDDSVLDVWIPEITDG